MLTFTSFSSSPRSSTIRSSTGSTAWHGPHHSAQKSTSTGLSLCATSVSQLDSVTAVAMWFRPFVASYLSGRTPKRRARFPNLRSPPDAVVSAAAGETGPSGARARGSRLVGRRARVRPRAGAEPRRPEVQVHGWSHHGQRTGRRSPRDRPHVEGRLPALQGDARLRRPLPERLR